MYIGIWRVGQNLTKSNDGSEPSPIVFQSNSSCGPPVHAFFSLSFFSLCIDDLRFCISSINRWMYIGLRTVKILIYSISDLSEHLNVLMSYSFIKQHWHYSIAYLSQNRYAVSHMRWGDVNIHNIYRFHKNYEEWQGIYQFSQ